MRDHHSLKRFRLGSSIWLVVWLCWPAFVSAQERGVLAYPAFECPDINIQEIYNFRWRVFQEHLKETSDGFVVTEFLPSVDWAGKHNTISCAAGHHFREGRWLHDPRFLSDYARFWFRGGGEPRRYSFWAADSLVAFYLASGDLSLLKELLPDLIQNYQAWEKSHRDENGLNWQIDDRDGMEYSLGGSGYRPTINSYQYGDAIAIARAAKLLGQPGVADEYSRKAAEIKRLVQDRLWDNRLDRVRYHGHWLTVFYDRTGERYRQGAGLHVFADGRMLASHAGLGRLTAALPQGAAKPDEPAETAGGWRKAAENPVMGGKLGTCFDVSLLEEGGRFRMWFSWRPRASVALVESNDGIHWSEPVIVLGPNSANDWERDINRPVVLKKDKGYHMWYTGQANGHSWIGHATSADGKEWKRESPRPVLSPQEKWEKVAVMCPHVLWDETTKRFRMWYSGGEQYEPNAIGYATSLDGNTWEKSGGNPIFRPDSKTEWEKDRVTACQVIQHGDWYLMFYIGFRDQEHAQIGVARSKDGVTNWQRHPANPIIRPGRNRWDHDAVYKPFALFDGTRWLLWYNGRRGGDEQIGLAIHEGEDLGF